MKRLELILILFLLTNFTVNAQNDNAGNVNDSLSIDLKQNYSKIFSDIEQQRVADSIETAELKIKLGTLKSSDNVQIELIPFHIFM